MSRIAKKPIALPKGVEINAQPESISVKGPKGTLSVPKPLRIFDTGIAQHQYAVF